MWGAELGSAEGFSGELSEVKDGGISGVSGGSVMRL